MTPPAGKSSQSAVAVLLLLCASAACHISAATDAVPGTVTASAGSSLLPDGYTATMARADGESVDSELDGTIEVQAAAAAAAAGSRSADSGTQAGAAADEAVHRPSGRSMLGNPPTYVAGQTFRVTATGRCRSPTSCRLHDDLPRFDSRCHVMTGEVRSLSLLPV